MAPDKPKLRLNIRSPAAGNGEALKKAAEIKRLHNETFDEAWTRILSMKNSDADMRRLREVKAAMEAGVIGREEGAAGKRFSKAEALRLWRVLEKKRQAEKLRKMVEETPDNYWLITDKAKLDEFLAIIKNEEKIVFDIESTGVDVWSDYIVGHVISAVKADIHAYIPTKHDVLDEQLDDNYVLEKLRPIYENKSIGKIAHNAKYDIHMLANAGVELNGLIWDTQVAMHVLNENERFQGRSYQLKELVSYYLKIPSATYSELFGKKGFNEIPLDVALAYAAKDGEITYKLYEFQRHHLERIGLLEYYEKVENPIIYVSIEMERAGFYIDKQRAAALSKQLCEELTEIERQLRQHFGDINFNSPAQLSKKFYDELKLDRFLPDAAKLSTDVSTLKTLAKYHDGIGLLLKYREKTKLLNTYIEALPKHIRKDGKVHGEFNQDGTVTGRFASRNPNLQNQDPIARQLFIAPPGHVILSADYSQQEPRWLAHFTGEQLLIDVYNEGKDLYTETAADLFGLSAEQCGKGSKYRDMMKTGFLATMYGTGPKTLAQQLGISEKEAREFLEQFARRYRKVSSWVNGNEEHAKKFGYVKMYLGRKRRLPEARSSDKWERFRAMRQATNAIIQGSSAIHTKITLINVQELCRRKGWTLAFTVHDEIGLYVPENITYEDAKEFERVMRESVKLKVPIKADVEIGRRWSDMMSIDEWFANR